MSVVEAVVFDWGGTLTPWHEVDLRGQWYAYAAAYDPVRAATLAGELFDAEQHLWDRQRASRGEQGCGTLDAMFGAVGIDVRSHDHLRAMEAYLEFWAPHTFADPDAVELLAGLRRAGLRIGVLSNTMWPRAHHQQVFARDKLLHLIDAAVYTSELPVGKPHVDTYRAALDQLGVAAGATVFVGDRLLEDVAGPQAVGMRAIWLPNTLDQEGDSHIVPDAVVRRLGEVAEVVAAWRSAAAIERATEPQARRSK